MSRQDLEKIKMIEHAQIRHPEITFVCANAHQLPFPDGKFDLITCTEILEHVADPLAVLFEIRHCLSLKWDLEKTRKERS